jgi:hypothetical protein
VQEQLGRSSIKLTVDTYGRWLRKKASGAETTSTAAAVPKVGASQA